MTKIIRALGFLLLFALCLPSYGVAFYVGAHPDDIELFMGRNAALDASSGAKIVFINTTAGDMGFGTGPGINSMGQPYNSMGLPYYAARRTGHERAIRFMGTLNGAALSATASSQITIAGKILTRKTIGSNLVIYDLLLPDGGGGTTGYTETCKQSLPALYAGTISRINQITNFTSGDSTCSPLDSRKVFTLSELKAVLIGIVAYESPSASGMWVNMTDEDPTRNPNDHADHIATSQIMRDALTSSATYWCAGIARYRTYDNERYAQNMTGNDLWVHYGTWGALNSGLERIPLGS